MEKREQHQPGYIPHAELDGVYQFLLWLVVGDHNVYKTPSTDIFCLAVLLENLGLKIKITLEKKETFDESDVVIVWSDQFAPTACVRVRPKFRPGMRILLSHMEEVISLFPRKKDRNKLRGLFEIGMEAVQFDGISLQPAIFEDNLPRVKGSPFLESEQDLCYQIRITSREKIPRLGGNTSRFSGWLLPTESPAACARLAQVIVELNQSSEEEHNVHTLALSLDNQQQDSRSYGLNIDYGYGDALIHLQAFFLDYWYQLLQPLLETSELEHEERFGSWGWFDVECLDFMREMIHTRMHQRTKSGKVVFMYRHEVLKLTAYLFGGAEIGQIRRAAYGSVGIIGKIPILYTSLVRGRPSNFGMFSLLDVDASFIPSNDSGIVVPGEAKAIRFLKAPKVSNRNLVIQPQVLKDIKVENLVGRSVGEEDFTVHIEPDWSNDSQTCLVVYRHRGRVITRVNPRQIDLALARHICDKKVDEEASEDEVDNSPPYKAPSDREIMHLSAFQCGRPVEPADQLIEISDHAPGYVFKPLVLQTTKMINAFICISCLYEGWETKKRLAIVSTQKEFDTAVAQFAKVMVIMTDLHAL